MDQCRYCRQSISRGAKTCGDCSDYEMATRIACRVLDASDVESASLAAAIGAEIVREVLARRRLNDQSCGSLPNMSRTASVA